MVMLSKEIFGTLLFSTDKASYSTAALLRDTRVALFLAPTTADSGILSGAGGGGTLVGTSDGSTGSSSSDGTDLIPVISTLTTTFPAYNVTQPNDLTIDLANEFRNRCNLGNAFTWSASMETDAREALLTAIPDPYADDDVAVLCGALCFVITNKTTNDTSSSSDADPSSSDAGGFIVSSQRKQCQSATRNVYMVIKTSIQDDQFDSVFSLTNAMATVDIVFSCVIVVSLNITLGFPVFVLNKKIRSVLTGIPMRLGDRRNRGLVATQCLWMSDMKSLMNVFHVMAALFVSNRKYVPDFILHRQLRELREARLFEQTGDDNDMLLGGSDSGGLGGRHSSSMSNLHGGASSVMSGSFAEQDDLNEMDDEMFEEEEDEEDLEEYEESNAEGLAQRLPAGQEEARRSPRALSHSISRGEHDAHHDDGYDEDVEMSFVTAPAGHGKGGGRLSATGRRLQRRTTRNDGDDDEIRRVRRGLRALSLTTANLADTQQQQNKHSRSPSSGPLGSNGPRKGSRSMGGTGDFDSSSSFAATSGTGGGGKMQHLGLLNATSVADLTQSTSAGAFGGTTNSKLKATRRTGSTVAVHVAPEESQPKSGKGGQIASGTAAAVAATNRLPDLNSLCPRNPVTILVLQFVSLEDAFASDFRNAERQHKIVVLAMSTVIRRNRGEIFERSGERVCVAWNAFDHRPDHAQRAAKCAMEIAGLFHQFRQDGMRMGIVLHQGPVVCGVLGDSHGAASLLFGKTADVAQRVAWLATQLPCFNILITERDHGASEKVSSPHLRLRVSGCHWPQHRHEHNNVWRRRRMQTTVDPANDTALFDVLQQTTHQNQLHHNRDQSFEVSISNLLLNTVNSRASTAQQRSPSPQSHHHGGPTSSKDSLRVYDIRGSAAGSAALPPRSHQFLNHGADAAKGKKNTSMSPAGATAAGDPGNHQWMRKDLLAQYHTAFSHFEHHRFAEALDILGDIAATMNEEDVYDNDD
ncbi:protein kinase, putative, partial [Bodo saltans]